jgi:hypothetical protein
MQVYCLILCKISHGGNGITVTLKEEEKFSQDREDFILHLARIKQ